MVGNIHNKNTYDIIPFLETYINVHAFIHKEKHKMVSKMSVGSELSQGGAGF